MSDVQKVEPESVGKCTHCNGSGHVLSRGDIITHYPKPGDVSTFPSHSWGPMISYTCPSIGHDGRCHNCGRKWQEGETCQCRMW
jgi:hypothetical protein